MIDVNRYIPSCIFVTCGSSVAIALTVSGLWITSGDQYDGLIRVMFLAGTLLLAIGISLCVYAICFIAHKIRWMALCLITVVVDMSVVVGSSFMATGMKGIQ